jgi:hypothetical protein
VGGLVSFLGADITVEHSPGVSERIYWSRRFDRRFALGLPLQRVACRQVRAGRRTSAFGEAIQADTTGGHGDQLNRSVSDAAGGTGGISRRDQPGGPGCAGTSAGIGGARQATADLARMLTELKALVDGRRDQVHRVV